MFARLFFLSLFPNTLDHCALGFSGTFLLGAIVRALLYFCCSSFLFLRFVSALLLLLSIWFIWALNLRFSVSLLFFLSNLRSSGFFTWSLFFLA